MSRGRIAAVVIAVVAVAGLLVLLLAYGQGWWKGEGGSFAPTTPVTRATISPRSALFGDTLTAHVEVLVDPRRVDPSTVQLQPVFAPFKVVSQRRTQGDGPGASQAVGFTYALECLTADCVQLMVEGKGAGRETRSIQLRPPRVTARTAEGSGMRIPVTWPTFVLHSRLSGPEIDLATPDVERTFVPPKPSWRLSPTTVGAASLVGAVLLVLGATWLVVAPLTRDSRRLRMPRIPKHLTPIERALRLAEHAAAAGEGEEERKALQRLAVELERQGSVELAGRAGRLAWSEGEPTPDTVGALAADVRGNGAR